MKLSGLCVLLCLAAAALADPVPNLEDYQVYLRYFNKDQETRSDVSEIVFNENIAAIREHNEKFHQGEVTYSKGINQFTDMTEREIQEYVKGLPEIKKETLKQWPTDRQFVQQLQAGAPAPENFSWIDRGAVTSVKDQGQCGSCAAFATAASLDSCFYKATGKLFDDVSEQFLVDCGRGHNFNGYRAFGCDGAFPQAYFDFLQTKSGGKIQTESAYRYTASDDQCTYSTQGWYTLSQMVSWKNVWNPDEEMVKQWIAEIGPVTTSVFVSNEFASYRSGVLNARDCCNQNQDPHCSDKNNHAVTIVGYGRDQQTGLKYWLVKNSWSPRWGDRGYIKVIRGQGHCGLLGQMAAGPIKCTGSKAAPKETNNRHNNNRLDNNNNNRVNSINTDKTDFFWESGKEYVYGYSGRLLTGIPELASVYSGIVLNCTVHIQRNDQGAENSFTLAIKNPKYVRVNEKLEPEEDSSESANWRQLRLPELSEVSGEFGTILSKPILFSMTNGEIHSAKISKDEPTWSVNFKKALALHFQTKYDASSIQEENNMVNRESSDELQTYWKVKEETIDGVCENTYEVRELPKYMVTERPEMVPYPEACPKEKYFSLTKTKDVAKCEKRSAFNYFAPGHFGYQLSGNNLNMWSRSSNTRYIACGTRGNLVIQTIINDGELNQNLLGYKNERFVTGTMQVLHLKEIREASSNVIPEDLVTLGSMMYEHSHETFVHQIKGRNCNQQERRAENLANDGKIVRQALPRNFFYGVSSEDVSSEEIMSQLKKYLSEIIQELTQRLDTKNTQITSKVMSVSRGFLLLKSKEEIASVYEELKSEFGSNEEDLVSMKSVFFDTLLMSGSPQSILYIKDKIISGDLTTIQMSNFFIWMPTYVRLPTEELLRSLYELVTSDKIRENNILYSKAIMGFSTLLNKACISSFRQTMYPINVFGEFCKPESEVIVSKWIPYLVHDLKYSRSYQKRNEIIVSLGLLQHKSIIGELLPFVEGTFEDTTTLNRYLAVQSLSNIGSSSDPTLVVPIFFSILSNPSESTTLRIAAFNSLLKQNPSMIVMQKIGSMTWTINDEELQKVINIAFFTLSKESELQSYDETVFSLPKKAFLVYPMIKKTEGILPSSATVFSSEHLRELGVGYDSMTTWISGKTSFIPKDIQTEMTDFLDQLRFTPISLGVHLSGAENLYSQMEKLFGPTESLQNDDESNSETEDRNKVNQEWKKIIKELKLKVRDNGPMDGAFFLRVFESAPIFYNFDKLTPEQLQEKISPFLANPQMIKDKLCGDFPLNFQQTLDRTPTTFMIPSDMGFPIVMEVSMPVALSIRGNLNIQCESLIPSISLKTTIVANSEYSGSVGTTIPFTKEYTVTGVQEQIDMNIPIKMELNFDILSSKVSFSFKPETGSINNPIDLIHYHVKPFTTYKKISDLTPLTLSSNVLFIQSREELKKMQHSFGDYLGLSLKSCVETESPYTDLQSFLDVLKLDNNNPVNALRFLWTSPALTEMGKPSMRRHEFSLNFDPSTSTSKEIQFDFKFGYGQKVRDSQNIKYKKWTVKNNQQGQNQENKLFEIENQDIDSESIHPRRQQKIQQALRNLNVESGHGVTVICTTTLKGSRPRSWSYAVTVATGKQFKTSQGIVKSKWDIHLESETSSSCPVKEICIKGEMDMPVLPLWNTEDLHSRLMEFHYINEINFGKSSCSESSIKVVGNAKVSHKQKEYSQQSETARKCQKLLEKNGSDAKLSDVCEQTLIQEQTFDEVDFNLEYKNVPEAVRIAESRFIEYLKIYLWPHLRAVKNSELNNVQEQSNNSNVLCQIQFSRETPSFDLIINKPDQSITFSKIRIPYPINLVFPMNAARNNAYSALKSITGGSFTPECKIGKERMTTFDNKTIELNMDNCFHLMSGDCSKDRTFGILARNMGPENDRRELKIFLGKVFMVLTPSARQPNDPFFADIRVTVDNEELTLPANSWKSIVFHNQEYGSIFRSSDNVFQLVSTQYNAHFMFDGTDTVIYASNLLKGKLCGVCGDFNQQSQNDMTGPSKCVHARPETFVASYRIQSDQCDDIPMPLKKELEQEQQKCVQHKQINTKVINSLKAQTGKCSVHKHIVVERSGQVCISKRVVTECSSGCKVADGQMVSKTVPFTCMPQGRTAELYVQKANKGQGLPELRNLETTFESNVEQPKRCVSSIKKKGVVIPAPLTQTEMERPSLCYQEKKVGSCHPASFPRWFYNQLTGRCAKFFFSGCLGNTNNFASKEECDVTCKAKDCPTICTEEYEPVCGSDNVTYTNQCRLEVAACNNPDQHITKVADGPCIANDVCRMPLDDGQRDDGSCRARLPRFYFNVAAGECQPFVFTGCNGNGNNFRSLEDCKARCKPDLCHLKPETGNCDAYFKRWFYDAASRQCRQFVWGGCQGNSNNFETKESCRSRCFKEPETPKRICSLPSETGPCKADIPRFFFNRRSGRCETFSYGGCSGNANNFMKKSDCEVFCRR